MEYIQALKNEGRDDDLPRYIIVSDFARIALHDLEEDQTTEFTLDEFYRCVDNFASTPGYARSFSCRIRLARQNHQAR